MDKDYLSKLFNLKGKVALVTGATGQLGHEICKAYVKSGLKVVGADNQLNSSRFVRSKNISYMDMDITNKESVTAVFAKIYSRYKRLDILLNNAGVSTFEPFEKRTEASFTRVVDVNLKGTFLCIQTYLKMLKAKNHKGNIINIASIYGIISPDYRIYTDCNRNSPEVYGAAKAGVIQMTRYFAVHAARYGVRVNCISPGGIFNPHKPQGSDFIKNYSDRCPLGRMANTDDLTGGVLYLSSEASGYLTGHNLVIDGGMSSW